MGVQGTGKHFGVGKNALTYVLGMSHQLTLYTKLKQKRLELQRNFRGFKMLTPDAWLNPLIAHADTAPTTLLGRFGCALLPSPRCDDARSANGSQPPLIPLYPLEPAYAPLP